MKELPAKLLFEELDVRAVDAFSAIIALPTFEGMHSRPSAVPSDASRAELERLLQRLSEILRLRHSAKHLAIREAETTTLGVIVSLEKATPRSPVSSCRLCGRAPGVYAGWCSDCVSDHDL